MSNLVDRRLSYYTNDQFPQFTHEDGELLIRFIQLYYEWLEEYDTQKVDKRYFDKALDVDNAPEVFFQFLREEFLKNIPKKLLCDEHTLLKYIQDYFRAKGNEKSFRLLFRILFNEEIEFYNPADDIFRGSDGEWLIESYFDVALRPNISLDDRLGSQLRGQLSKAKARIERVERYFEGGFERTYIYFSNKINDFFPGENLIDDKNVIIGSISDIVTLPGRYLSSRGFASEDKYLQDGYFYQEYSYVVKSTQAYETLKPLLDMTVHPAGTIFFNQYYTFAEIDSGMLGVHQEISFELSEQLVTFDSLLDSLITILVDFETISSNPFGAPERTNFRFERYASSDSGTVASNGSDILTGTNTTFNTTLFTDGNIIIINPVDQSEVGKFRVTEIISPTSVRIANSGTIPSFAGMMYKYSLGVINAGAGNIFLLEDTFAENANFKFSDAANLSFQDAMNRRTVLGVGTAFRTNITQGTVLSVYNPDTQQTTYTNIVSSVVSNTIIQVATPFAADAVITNDQYITKGTDILEESDLS